MLRNIEIKKLDQRAIIPKYATADSAGVDLAACIDKVIEIPPLETALIPTGLAINMQLVEEDLVAMIFPRSGKGHKEGKVLGNTTGIIDSDYQGQLMVSILNRNKEKYITIEPGERIAQMICIPIIRAEFSEVEEFSSSTERGTGGFGSTGN
jgi:dUTP pyrophosphatase